MQLVDQVARWWLVDNVRIPWGPNFICRSFIAPLLLSLTLCLSYLSGLVDKFYSLIFSHQALLSGNLENRMLVFIKALTDFRLCFCWKEILIVMVEVMAVRLSPLCNFPLIHTIASYCSESVICFNIKVFYNMLFFIIFIQLAFQMFNTMSSLFFFTLWRVLSSNRYVSFTSILVRQSFPFVALNKCLNACKIYPRYLLSATRNWLHTTWSLSRSEVASLPDWLSHWLPLYCEVYYPERWRRRSRWLAVLFPPTPSLYSVCGPYFLLRNERTTSYDK